MRNIIKENYPIFYTILFVIIAYIMFKLSMNVVLYAGIVFSGDEVTINYNNMEPELPIGTKVLVVPLKRDKKGVIEKRLERNQYVIKDKAEDVNNLLVQKVVGVPGDRINYVDGVLFVNDKKVIPNPDIYDDIEYTEYKKLDIGKLTFKEEVHLYQDEYWVINTNEISAVLDSRDYGKVRASDIYRKVARKNDYFNLLKIFKNR